jgi:hypothetical protein
MKHYEFLKLDEIDRDILIWLIEHVPAPAIKSWLACVKENYRRKKRITLDVDRIMDEIQKID